MNIDNRDDLERELDEESCGHPACACDAGPGGYCSPTCEAQADEAEADTDDEIAKCGCGHADCADAEALSDTGS